MYQWLKSKLTRPEVWLAFALPCQASDVRLGTCINDIYQWAIAIVGLLAFIQIVWAGTMYLRAAGKVGDVKEAKSRISNAILGIVLLFSSYLILKTINPALVGSDATVGSLTTGGGGGGTDQTLSLLGLSPIELYLDGTLSLTGVGFSKDVQVMIENNPVEFFVISPNEISVDLNNDYAPGQTYSLWLESGSQKSAVKRFTVVEQDQITLSSINPTSGQAGSQIELKGNNFVSATRVLWDGNATEGEDFRDAHTLTFKIPVDAEPGDHSIGVGQDGNNSSTLTFEVTE